MVRGIKPRVGFCVDGVEPPWDSLSLPLSLWLSPTLEIDKETEKEREREEGDPETYKENTTCWRRQRLVFGAVSQDVPAGARRHQTGPSGYMDYISHSPLQLAVACDQLWPIECRRDDVSLRPGQ